MIIIDLIYNLSVLVALCTLSGFIDSKFDKSTNLGKILQGLLFSFVAIIGMMYPFMLSDGIIFDGRSIVISLATLFFGPITGIISAVSAIIFRNYLGGGGALTGSLVITASFIIGYIYHNYMLKKQFKLTFLDLYLFGLIVNTVMMILMLTLPSSSINDTFKLITITVIGIFPFITVIIGKILLDHYESKSSFDKISESENLFRTTLYSIGDALITTDKNGNIIHLNKVAEELTEWTEVEAKGQYIDKVFNIISESTRQRAENPVAKVLEKGYVVGLANHTLLITKNGNEIPIADSGAPIKDLNGKTKGVVLVFRNQTEERQKQIILEQSEQKFRKIINSTSEGIFIHSAKNGDIVDVNNTGIKMFGYDDKITFINSYNEIFNSSEDNNQLQDALKYLGSADSDEKIIIEWLAQKQNGDKFWTEVSLFKTEIEGYERIISVVRDITERINSQKEIVESEIMLKKAQIIAKMGSWTWYVKEDTVKWSDEMFNIFQIDKQDNKIDLFDIIQSRIHPEDIDSVNKSNETAIKEKKPLPMEYRIVLPDGEIKTVWAEAGEMLLDEDNNLIQLSGMVQDITEAKKVNIQLLEAKEKAEESDRLKTAFLQNMSHEIRTPLNGLIGFTRLLNYEDNSREEIKEYSQIIEASGNRLLELINNIIDVSKIESGNIRTNLDSFSISKLIEEIYHQQFGSAMVRNLELKFVIPEKEIVTKSDSLKVHQILSNLVSNAIKFTDIGTIEFGYNYDEDNITFFVKDSGIGIAQIDVKRIFDRFYQSDSSITRSYEGSGLGLSICKGLVELLKGRIWVESELGNGSTFYFNIPLAESTQKAIENTSKVLVENISASKILIVENDYVSYIYLNKLLKRENIELSNVSNGLEAVDFCNANPDINLILMDIKMPVMNGLDATRIIKKMHPQIKIIAQTAFAFTSDIQEAKLAGCDDYLIKPIDKNTLLDCINKYM